MNNPYTAPLAVLSDPAEHDDTYKPRFLSVHGRIGRVRYVLYSFISSWLLSLILGIVAALALGGGGKNAGLFAMGLIYVPVLAVALIMAKRRLNDLDRSGWFALLMLVPFLNLLLGLYLVFGAGSPGTNKYGLKPCRNPGALLFVVIGIIVIFMVGIVAAIAIPQYQKYVTRAKANAVQVQP